MKTWKHKKFGKASGSYNTYKGNRHFILTNLKTKKTMVYESPQAAKDAGWVYEFE